MPKAYSYLRFSTPEQMKGDSMRRQTRLAEEYAKRHGLELDTELNLRDLGVSAFRGANIATGALGAFLDAIRKDIVPRGSFLLVESLDRVSRSAARKAVRTLEEIVEAGVTVVTLNDGKAYTEESLDGTDFLIAIIILIRAHEESATKAKRLKAAWFGKRLTARDKALTALTPGWIELNDARKPVLIAERALVVRRIVREFLRGTGKHGIAKRLNQEGVPRFGRAKYWHRSYIDKMLTSPALIGTFVPHVDDHDAKSGKFRRIPQEPVRDYFPAVIDADTFQQVQSLVDRSALRGRHAHMPMQNVLSGLARCPVCEGTMTRATKGGSRRSGKPFLICTNAKTGAGCTYRSVPYDDIEGTLLGSYEWLLDEMPHWNTEIEGELRNAQVQADVLQSRLSDMLDVLERQPSDALARRIAKLEVDVTDAQKALANVTARAAQTERKAVQLRAEELGVAIRARPVDRRRINAALSALVERVTVAYSTGHLVFTWKSGGESSLLFAWPESQPRSQARQSGRS